MNNDNKFSNLARYFSELTVDEVSLSFEQIERIVGEKLCNSAYKHIAYWHPKTHTFPNCWIDNGYKMFCPSLKE